MPVCQEGKTRNAKDPQADESLPPGAELSFARVAPTKKGPLSLGHSPQCRIARVLSILSSKASRTQVTPLLDTQLLETRLPKLGGFQFVRRDASQIPARVLTRFSFRGLWRVPWVGACTMSPRASGVRLQLFCGLRVIRKFADSEGS